MVTIKQNIYVFLFILLNNIQIIFSGKTEPNYYRYLEQFGYAPKALSTQRSFFKVIESQFVLSSSDNVLHSEVDSSSDDTAPSINKAILTFQRLYKLPQTGRLDEKTKKFMQRARCGNPDFGSADFIENSNNIKLKSSFLIQRRSINIKSSEDDAKEINHWPKKHLKWFIEEYPKKQKYLTSNDHIRRIINQAFHDWEKYSQLKFEMVETKEQADLNIKFQTYHHDDQYPFDGQGGTLAHAFYPTIGDIHFDDDEIFTDDYTDNADQYTLRLLATHEIGHALGLKHTFDEKSIMFPMYQQFNSDYKISNNDQQTIQKFYGKSENKTINTTLSPITSTPSTNISSINNWCSGDFQTGCEGPDGELYLFKDNQAWRYRSRGKHSWDPQPKLINKYFPSLIDTKITACVKSKIGYTYLFHHNHIWKLKTHWSIDGPYIIHGKNYPKNSHIALLHQNSIYLIDDQLVYRLNEFNFNKQLDIDSIDTILKPPPNEFMHTGFTYAQQHYIFTRNHVYVYNSNNGNLLSGYPKSLPNGWFACQTASSQISKEKKKLVTTYHKNHERANHHQSKRPFHHHH